MKLHIHEGGDHEIEILPNSALGVLAQLLDDNGEPLIDFFFNTDNVSIHVAGGPNMSIPLKDYAGAPYVVADRDSHDEFVAIYEQMADDLFKPDEEGGSNT